MIKVRVENKEQLDKALSSKMVDEVIISRDSFAEKDLTKFITIIKKANKKASIMLERISRYEEIKNLRTSTDKVLDIENLDAIVVQNIDSFAYILRKLIFAKNKNLEIELNYTMNCYNKETKDLYTTLFNESLDRDKEGLMKVALSFVTPVELNAHELNDVGYDTIVVYGYIDTMVSANCLRKNTLYCDKNAKICQNRFDFDKVENNVSFIKDRKNKELYYKTYCKYCYNKIFNTDVLYLLDMDLDFKNIRLDFTIEDGKEVEKILMNLEKRLPYTKKNFTRGHIKNTIV